MYGFAFKAHRTSAVGLKDGFNYRFGSSLKELLEQLPY